MAHAKREVFPRFLYYNNRVHYYLRQIPKKKNFLQRADLFYWYLCIWNKKKKRRKKEESKFFHNNGFTVKKNEYKYAEYKNKMIDKDNPFNERFCFRKSKNKIGSSEMKWSIDLSIAKIGIQYIGKNNAVRGLIIFQ